MADADYDPVKAAGIHPSAWIFGWRRVRELIWTHRQQSWRRAEHSRSSHTGELISISQLPWKRLLLRSQLIFNIDFWISHPLSSATSSMLVPGDGSTVALSENLWAWSRNFARRKRRPSQMKNQILSKPICEIWSLYRRWLDPLLVYTPERISIRLKLGRKWLATTWANFLSLSTLIHLFCWKEYTSCWIYPQSLVDTGPIANSYFTTNSKPVKHGRPGIGATHSSRFIPLSMSCPPSSNNPELLLILESQNNSFQFYSGISKMLHSLYLFSLFLFSIPPFFSLTWAWKKFLYAFLNLAAYFCFIVLG